MFHLPLLGYEISCINQHLRCRPTGSRATGLYDNAQNQIQQLRKEWIKTGENCLPEELRNIFENPINSEGFQFFSRRILERDKNGCLPLHSHISESFSKSGIVGMIQGDAEVSEHCAVAQFLVSEKHGKESGFAMAPVNSGISVSLATAVTRLSIWCLSSSWRSAICLSGLTGLEYGCKVSMIVLALSHTPSSRCLLT
jgi:hypothetical protein